VGAGIGIESILYSRAVGANGRVIAIEAHPRTYACLVKTCEYSSLTNVTPLNIALVDREQLYPSKTARSTSATTSCRRTAAAASKCVAAASTTCVANLA
jgi:FkbM family methyltransferase